MVRLSGQAHTSGHGVLVCLCLHPCRTHGGHQNHTGYRHGKNTRHKKQDGKAALSLLLISARHSLSDRFAVFRGRQVLFTAVQVFIEAAVKIILPEIREDSVFHTVSARFGKGIIRTFSVEMQTIVPLGHTEQQGGTSLLLTHPQMILLIEIDCGFKNITRMGIIRKIIHHNQIQPKLIGVADFLCPCLQCSILVVGQQPRRIRHMVKLRLRLGRHRNRQRKHQQRRKKQK